MDMKTFLKTSDKSELILAAELSGTTVDYFRQIAGGHRKASPLLAKKIEESTGGLVKKECLRPDVFTD